MTTSIDDLLSLFGDSFPFRELERAIAAPGAGGVVCRGARGSLVSFLAVHLHRREGKTLLLVTPTRDEAEKTRDDCALLAGEAATHLYAVSADAAERRTMELTDVAMPIAQNETLRALMEKRSGIVVASAESLSAHVPPPAQFARRLLEIEKGRTISFSGLLLKLSELGFERKDFAEEIGDFAVRGGILDIFPFSGDHPVRIEFWGDTVESIREFEVVSQRSIRELQTAQVTARMDDAGSTATLFDYLPEDVLIVVLAPELCRAELRAEHEENAETMIAILEERAIAPAQAIFSDLESPPGATEVNIDSLPQPHSGGSMKILLSVLRGLQAEGYRILLASDTAEEAERLQELLDEERALMSGQNGGGDAEMDEAPSLKVERLAQTVHAGFVFPAARIALFAEHEVFGRLKRRGTKRRPRFKGITQKELSQLRRGDFVVHEDYGIGRFAGLQKIRVSGGEQEVMKLHFAEQDSVYVNLNFINRVQKYSSREGHLPALTKLGTAQWERLKSRAKKQLKEMARELIRLYARRKTEPGFAFAPDTHWQKEMEASFMYEDTPDQAKATVDIKTDMENPSPMDRLVCGDVGFGKTEVAIRAAFKAVMSGKQTALLVPTTILALQHLNTFRDRIARYGVRVEMLSRFRTAKEQKLVVESLAQGQVDIVIGTHRLLSKDVAFKDLGLLIIDEEHRFGVDAKEKIRHLKAAIDTLTLTATPIPRTLHFSLLGARDLSLINTPPRNRLPVETDIIEFDTLLIREIVRRELNRNGQVFVINDKIQTMEALARQIAEAAPEARIGTAHGQMEARELERAMLAFMEKKYDILVCTKIIESGIDIPTVNTIIVNHADTFGLAELYQLRGRVGRSNTQAFAYLMVRALNALPKQSLQRLTALQEFTELGSGFNLAMRDLEIRGAGNLLGKEQSGFILEMGFELYQKIVEEAVQELRREEFAEVFEEAAAPPKRRVETQIESDIEALIPDFYCESDTARLEFYQRIQRAETAADLTALRAELQDRFGEYPPETEHLFRLVELKLLAGQIGFRKLQMVGSRVLCAFPPEEEKEFYDAGEGGENAFQRLMKAVQAMQEFSPQLKQATGELWIRFTIPRAGDPAWRLGKTEELLSALLESAR